MTTLSIGDVTVLPNATSATVKLVCSNPPRDTIIVGYASRAKAGNPQFTPVNGTFIIHPGTLLTRDIVVPLGGANVAGAEIEVYLGTWVQGASLGDGTATISFANPVPAKPPALVKVYETNFVTGFQFSDTGLLPDGTPCWQSRHTWGRDQAGNKEIGLYVDPVVHPGTNPFPIVNGKRALRSEKLTTPIVYNGKSFNYTAAILNSSKVQTVKTGGRIEIRAAMPIVGKKGAWPALWLLPADGSWPPEIDIMEWPITADGQASEWLYWTTQHWPVNGVLTSKAFGIDIRKLLNFPASSNLTNIHTFGLTITEDELQFDFDGSYVRSVAMENRTGKGLWYIQLDMAMGGTWPGYPYPATIPNDTYFPVDMVLDRLTVYDPI